MASEQPVRALKTRGKGKPKPKTIRILLDSGGSSTIVKKEFVKKLQTTKSSETNWNTVAGSFMTNEMCEAEFSLPELHEERLISWKCHVTTNDMNYDVIIG